MAFDVEGIRRDFPILDRTVSTLDGQERRLCYMDHGASTHPPRQVIEAVSDFLSQHYANIHRGNHTLSIESSDLFDGVYDTFADFIGAERDGNCFVLCQNTTTALDLAAHIMKEVDGVTLTSRGEHHSNDLPHRRAGEVVYADVGDQGRIRMDELEAQLAAHDVKLVAVTGASNVTGHIPDIHKVARLAHEHGARILVDAAQLYAHVPIDVKPNDHPEHIDFLAAAGHKAYAPYGSAFLFGPQDLMDAAEPYLPGGGTVDWVSDDGALYTASPDRHMGGTPNIPGAIAFATATQYLQQIGMENVRAHEVALTEYAMERFEGLRARHGIRVVGPEDADERVGVFSFDVPDVRHEMVSAVLNHEHAIATRNGCFCAHPLLHRLLGLSDTTTWMDAIQRGEKVPLPGLVRATVGIYNTREELDHLFDALEAIAGGHIQGEYDTTDHKLCKPVEFDSEAVRLGPQKAA